MTASIGDGPDMDVYADEIAAHAAHPASASRFRAAQAKRIDARAGRTDIFTGEFVPFTAEEIAATKAEHRHSLAVFGFFFLVMAAMAVCYWLGTLQGAGRLS